MNQTVAHPVVINATSIITENSSPFLTSGTQQDFLNAKSQCFDAGL